MRAVLLILSVLPLFGWNPQEDVNVNSRYTVEKVSISGKFGSHVSSELRREMNSVVGQKLDHTVLDRIAARLRHDLRVQRVGVRVHRGDLPDHVTVEFEVEGGRRQGFDVDIPKFAYHSLQGWSAAGQATTTIGKTALSFGLVSDGDAMVERFSGVRARVERESFGTHRLRAGFEFDAYHDQWNPSTLAAISSEPGSTELYRARENFQPSLTVVLGPSLTWTFGVSVQQLEMEAPGSTIESANAFDNTLRFQKGWEDTVSNRQALEGTYSFRAATRALGSDFVYVRHSARIRYEVLKGHNELTVEFLAGGLNGRAPLFERFVLGNASTLRGWNKFDLDPLGGDRAVHTAVDYRYGWLTVFYDTGIIWNGSVNTGEKHGAGCGFRSEGKEGFLLAVAFPLRAGHVDPVFLAGFNF
jgi:hypothetical protein